MRPKKIKKIGSNNFDKIGCWCSLHKDFHISSMLVKCEDQWTVQQEIDHYHSESCIIVLQWNNIMST